MFKCQKNINGLPHGPNVCVRGGRGLGSLTIRSLALAHEKGWLPSPRLPRTHTFGPRGSTNQSHLGGRNEVCVVNIIAGAARHAQGDLYQER